MSSRAGRPGIVWGRRGVDLEMSDDEYQFFLRASRSRGAKAGAPEPPQRFAQRLLLGREWLPLRRHSALFPELQNLELEDITTNCGRSPARRRAPRGSSSATSSSWPAPSPGRGPTGPQAMPSRWRGPPAAPSCEAAFPLGSVDAPRCESLSSKERAGDYQPPVLNSRRSPSLRTCASAFRVDVDNSP